MSNLITWKIILIRESSYYYLGPEKAVKMERKLLQNKAHKVGKKLEEALKVTKNKNKKK